MKHYLKVISTFAFLFAFLFMVFQRADAQRRLVLNPEKELKILLDSSTHFYYNSLQVFENEDCEKLLALSYKNERKILIYSMDNPQLIRKIQYPIEGPNSVGTELGGFYIHNMDSIFVYDYWGRRLCLSDSSGEIKQSYNIEAPGTQTQIFPEASHLCPPHFKNGKVYLTGRIDALGKPEAKPMIGINIKDKSVSTYGRLPVKWFSNDYSFRSYVLYDYSDDFNHYVVDFIVTDSLFIFSDQWEFIKSVNVKSKWIDEIEPFDKARGRNAKDRMNAYAAAEDYAGIIYDPYRIVYYRLVDQGRTLQEAYAYKSSQVSIMVLDRNFNILGEYNTSEEEDKTTGLFVTEEGLYVPSKELYRKDENFLTFRLYEFK